MDALNIDLDQRDIALEQNDQPDIVVDTSDADVVFDPSPGDIIVEFGSVGLPGLNAPGSEPPTDLVAHYILASR